MLYITFNYSLHLEKHFECVTCCAETWCSLQVSDLFSLNQSQLLNPIRLMVYLKFFACCCSFIDWDFPFLNFHFPLLEEKSLYLSFSVRTALAGIWPAAAFLKGSVGAAGACSATATEANSHFFCPCLAIGNVNCKFFSRLCRVSVFCFEKQGIINLFPKRSCVIVFFFHSKRQTWNFFP